MKLLILFSSLFVVFLWGCSTLHESDETSTDSTDENEKNIHQLRKENRKLRVELSRLASPGGNVCIGQSCPPFKSTANQPRIEGVVLRYDRSAAVVQINRGKDVGVRLGYSLDLVRGEDFVCSIVIDYVDKDSAVGHISIPSTNGTLPAPGDRVTNLSGR